MEQDNITLRKIKSKSINDSFNLSFISTYSDYLSKSLPDLSSSNLYLEELKEEIKNLKMQLAAAHAEIENLSLENSELKKFRSGQETTISKLKSICSETSSSAKKKKAKKLSKNKTKLDTSVIDLGLGPDEEYNMDGTVCNAVQTSSDTQSKQVIIQQKPIEHITESPLDGTTCEKILEMQNKPQILILGGEQCTGLASKLIYSRRNTKFETYSISSITKPNAKSDEILKQCINFPDCENNYVILCIGENDTNPVMTIIHLLNTLKDIKKTNIIMLNVIKNKYLNQHMLNNEIKNVCSHFLNCSYLNITTDYYTQSFYLNEVCKKINLMLDSKYYDTYILPSYKNNLKIKKNKKCGKGTIPYYFPIIDKNTLQPKLQNDPLNKTFFRN